MEFRVLGPVELRFCGQRRALESGKVSGILAILLLTPGKIVAADDLIDRLWETSPPAGARGNLSVYVSRLRASFRRAGEDASPLRGRASGYVLDVDPETVDLHQFRHLRRRGSRAGGVGQSSEAVRLLREADLLWQGPAMAGLSGEWFAKMRGSVQEERRAAVIERVKLELELGLHVSLVGEIARLLDQYPMDETLIECQMTALYRGGRISEALSLFRETRSRIVEEQGTEPGHALTELHHRILRQDPYLSAPSTRIKPPIDPSRDARPMAFPTPLSERRRPARRFLGHYLTAADLADRRLIPPKRQVPIEPNSPAERCPGLVLADEDGGLAGLGMALRPSHRHRTTRLCAADPPVPSMACPTTACKANAIQAQPNHPACQEIVMSVREKGITQ